MDRISPAAHPDSAFQSHKGVSFLEMLPDDVMPDIHSRLPAPELFALASVSRRFRQSVQSGLADATAREFRIISATALDRFANRLGTLLRIGGHHIRDADWTTFLQAAESRGFVREWVIALLSLASEDAALQHRPDTIAAAQQMCLRTTDLGLAPVSPETGRPCRMRFDLSSPERSSLRQS